MMNSCHQAYIEFIKIRQLTLDESSTQCQRGKGTNNKDNKY